MSYRDGGRDLPYGRQDTRAIIRELVLMTAGALIAAGWLFSRVLGSLGSVLAADRVVRTNDGAQNVWMLWWTSEAIRQGANPFFVDSIFYPLRINLFWQTLNVTNGLLALPITYTFGAVAAYNIVAISSFVLSTLAMYGLARVLTGSPVGAGAAAMIYAFSPFHVSGLYNGQLEIMSIQYFPLLTLGLFAISVRKSWPAALLSGVLVVWILLTSLYYGFFALIYAALFGIVFVLVYRPLYRDIVRLAGRFIVVALPSALLLLSQGVGTTSYNGQGNVRQTLHSALLVDFFLPSPHHPLWGDQIATLQARLHPGVSMITISLGTLIWPLAIIAAITLFRQKQAQLHIALTIICLLLTMGPWLVWNGEATTIPLPYALLSLLPGVQSGQRPNLFIVVAAVHFCLLAAFGMKWLCAKRPMMGRLSLSSLFSVLLVIDLIPTPIPGIPNTIPAVYRAIPPGSGALLEIPFQIDSAAPLFAQITHRRPLLGVYLARIPDYPFNHVDGIAEILSDRSKSTILSNDWLQSLVAVMSAQNIEYVLVHRDLLTPAQEVVADQLAQRLVVAYRDTQTTLYQRPIPAQPDLTIALGKGWYGLEHKGTNRWQWTDTRATIDVFNPHPTARVALIEFRMRSYAVTKDITVSMVQDASAPVIFSTITVTPADRTYHLLVNVPPGYAQIQLDTDHGEQNPSDDRLLGVRVQSIRFADLTQP